MKEQLERDLVVSRNPAVHSGDLVFTGTRVPVANLVGYLKHGRTVDDFLEGFPSVERWQIQAYLDLSPDAIEQMSGRGAGSS
jgi:uncharacterized protein (DUF433 family)